MNSFAAFLASADSGGHSVIYNISLCLVAASAMGVLCRFIRQPVMLGHLLAGVLLGPVCLGWISSSGDIETISEIGLILLLFMIGLEIDLHKMLSAGKWIIIPGLAQFPICLGLGFVAVTLLSAFGLSFGGGPYIALYAAIIISLSSTMIVVKLLHEKIELDTLPGRITVGILVFQDIWAILTLAIQPNLSNPKILEIAQTFGSGAALIIAVLLFSKYVLPHVFRLAASSSELMLVIALGWCFLVSLIAAHPVVGLSMEMGALMAGIALATFPYSVDVIAKVTSIRDFFITLFFVALAMKIPMPDAGVVAKSGIIALLVLLTRGIGVYAVLYLLKAGHRVALLAAVNLSQISEFGLVIVSLGISFGHVDETLLTHVIWVFSILAITSTYLVKYNDTIQRWFTRNFIAMGLKDVGLSQAGEEEARRHYPVVMLGFYRTSSALLHEISNTYPDWLEEIKVIDTNPEVKFKLDDMKVHCVYGDLSHKDSLEHAHIGDAKVVICGIPDYILKGTSNAKLLGVIRELCPNAQIILTAEDPGKAKYLYAKGAAYVLQPSVLSGADAMSALKNALAGTLDEKRRGALGELDRRDEVLTTKISAEEAGLKQSPFAPLISKPGAAILSLGSATAKPLLSLLRAGSRRFLSVPLGLALVFLTTISVFVYASQMSQAKYAHLKFRDVSLQEGIAEAEIPASKFRIRKSVYVPAHSHIYGEGGKPYLLETTLSIRNTDPARKMTVISVKYYDTKGTLVKELLAKPKVMAPLATMEFLVEKSDISGGSGANFIVEWGAEEPLNKPIVEAVMVSVGPYSSFAFVRSGEELPLVTE